MDIRTRRWLDMNFGEKAKDVTGPTKLYEFGEPNLFEVKAIEGSDDFFIEGYASTKSLDRGRDVVLPEAFKEAMAEYETIPLVHYMHNWWDYPIGRMDDYKIDDKGLWVRDYISKTAETERILISERILRALSIGYDPLEIEYIDKGQPTQYRVIKKLKLYEHSVVNIPMNAEALFEQAKAKGLKIKQFSYSPPEGRKEDPMLVKMFDASDGKGGAGVTLEEVRTVVKTSMDGVTGKLEEVGKTLTQIQEGAKATVTKAELEEFKTKATADLLAANKKFWDEQIPARKHQFEVHPALANSIKEPADFKAAIFGRAAEEVADDFGVKPERIKRLQSLHDDLLIVHTALQCVNKGYKRNPDITRLKTYQRYAAHLSEFHKALNTQTAAEGLEWIPTQWSADLLERVEVERRLAKFFTRFPQPTPDYTYPIKGSKPRLYIKGEATTDNAAVKKASTPSTAKVVFSTRGLAGAVYWSDEMDEDSIVPVVQIVKDDLVEAFVDGEEDILINGDDSAVHMDTDTQLLGADEPRRMFKGLRKFCNAAAKYDITTVASPLTAAFEGGDVVEVLKKGAKYAVNPMKTFLIASLNSYFDMLKFAEVKTVEVWAQNATYLRGALSSFLGRPIFPSEFIRADLDSTGVNGATPGNNVKTILVHVYPGVFKIGDRRQVTIEMDKDIETGLYVMVGTNRWSFNKMVAAADNPVSEGINI